MLRIFPWAGGARRMREGQMGLWAWGFVYAAIAACAACSSSSSNGGGGAGGDEAGVGGGGGGPSGCDSVVVADPDLMAGFGVALASIGDVLYVLKDSGTRRIVQVLQADQLQDVVGFDGMPTLYPGGAALVANLNGFYFDANSATARSIYRAPPSGGTVSLLADLSDPASHLSPPFVADGTSLYTRGAAPNDDSLVRIPQNADADAGVTATPIGNVFASDVSSEDDTSQPSYAMAISSSYVFTATGAATVTATPIVSSDAGTDTSDGGSSTPEAGAVSTPPISARFALAGCDGSLSAMAVADSAVLMGCLSADFTLRAIYQAPLPSAWSGATGAVTAATQVVSGNGINSKIFAVHGNNLYYVNDADPALYRLPIGGGEKVKIMTTHSVQRMVITNSAVFVLSTCGLQKASL
ncbi:MAG TPA: hypothetical protein VGL13_01365 [Polyangiaceae bacterium]